MGTPGRPAAAGVLAAAVVLVAAVAASGQRGQALPARRVHRTSVLPRSNEYNRRWVEMTQGVDRATALDVARKNDVILLATAAMGPFVPDMRAVNPDLVVVQYVNGFFDGNTAELASFPESMFLHDDAVPPKRITSRAYPGNYMMNPFSHQWWDVIID